MERLIGLLFNSAKQSGTLLTDGCRDFTSRPAPVIKIQAVRLRRSGASHCKAQSRHRYLNLFLAKNNYRKSRTGKKKRQAISLSYASSVSKYRWARPSIHMVNENLKLGYAMATFLLKTCREVGIRSQLGLAGATRTLREWTKTYPFNSLLRPGTILRPNRSSATRCGAGDVAIHGLPGVGGTSPSERLLPVARGMGTRHT